MAIFHEIRVLFKKRDFDSSLKQTRTAQTENLKSPTKQANFELQYELSLRKIGRELQKLRFITKMSFFAVFRAIFAFVLVYFAYFGETVKIAEKSKSNCFCLSVWVFSTSF